MGLTGLEVDTFGLGVDIAALTHGHPSGFLSAGFLASLVAAVVAGSSLNEAIQVARLKLMKWPDHQEVLDAVTKAETLALRPRQDVLRSGALGEGWVAEEALAIALYCSLATTS